jgi:hypothetical protein
MMFASDAFIQDCRDGLREQNPHAALREIVAKCGERLADELQEASACRCSRQDGKKGKPVF